MASIIAWLVIMYKSFKKGQSSKNNFWTRISLDIEDIFVKLRSLCRPDQPFSVRSTIASVKYATIILWIVSPLGEARCAESAQANICILNATVNNMVSTCQEKVDIYQPRSLDFSSRGQGYMAKLDSEKVTREKRFERR